VTPSARLEIQIAAESAAAAVTCRASVISGRKVLLRTRRADLPLLRQTARRVVTVVAIQTLARRVISVSKCVAVRGGCRRRARVRFRFVTNAAGSQVAPVCLRVRRVTGVAAVVRRDSHRNRQRGATSQTAAVATHATVLWPRRAGQMLRVIELHVEALFKLIRKSFARRVVAVHVLVTDGAHGDVRRRELRQMTTCAGFVSGKIGTRRIVGAAMTIIAAERRVFRTCVEEL